MIKKVHKMLRIIWLLFSKTVFLFLKINNTKNIFKEEGVFLTFVFFLFSKTIFLRIIKKKISLFKKQIDLHVFFPFFVFPLTYNLYKNFKRNNFF